MSLLRNFTATRSAFCLCQMYHSEITREIERDSTPHWVPSITHDVPFKCHWFQFRLIRKVMPAEAQTASHALKPSLFNYSWVHWSKLPEVVKPTLHCQMDLAALYVLWISSAPSQRGVVNLRELFFNCSVVFHHSKKLSFIRTDSPDSLKLTTQENFSWTSNKTLKF